jgi:hypothetical protein
MKGLINLSLLRKLGVIVFFAFFFFSCEDQIDVKLDEGNTLLVVDGWITDQPGPQIITLSTTAPYFNKESTPKVSGAIVLLSDNGGQSEILTEKEPGKYVTSEGFQGKVGKTYFLNIRHDGNEYKAETQIRRPAMIDSLSQKFREKSLSWEEGYYVLYNGPEQAGLGDFYRFKVYKNDTLQNKPENLIVAQDKFVDGNYIKEVELHNKPFLKGDHIRVENWAITEDAYQYYIEMLAQVNNGGMFANPPANIKTNIVTLNPDKARRAVGFFGGASVTSKEMIIK